jgi:Domain of unknown function (DUF4160)
VGKIRKGGFIFITRKGDHLPRHVHVFKSEREILKWDLENGQIMEGKATRRVRRLIQEMSEKGEI